MVGRVESDPWFCCWTVRSMHKSSPWCLARIVSIHALMFSFYSVPRGSIDHSILQTGSGPVRGVLVLPFSKSVGLLFHFLQSPCGPVSTSKSLQWTQSSECPVTFPQRLRWYCDGVKCFDDSWAVWKIVSGFNFCLEYISVYSNGPPSEV